MSVVVPTFNRARMLGECLESLLSQTAPALEILVVDDGSSDETPNLLRTFSAPVRYLRQENRGKPAALNTAIPETRGEWLWFFDDDDVALPRAIESRLHVLGAYPDADIVLSPFVWGSSDQAGRIVPGKPLRWYGIGGHTLYPTLLRAPCAHLSGALVKRTTALDTGGFRTDLLTSEDYDFILRAARGATVAISDQPSFIFRQHAGLRGPLTSRYEARDRLRQFAEGDAEVGRWIRKTHALPEYLGLAPHVRLDRDETCRALLARVAVMGSKGLFQEVAEDCVALIQLMGESSALDTGTADAVKSALQEDYLVLRGCAASHAFADAFSALRDTPLGRALLRVVARALATRSTWPDTNARNRYALLALGARLAGMGLGLVPVPARQPHDV